MELVDMRPGRSQDRGVKPLFHPAADDISVEGILHALSDPVRVRIFAEIAKANCPRTCSGLLEACDKAVPKSTLSQHFKVLREAGLVRSERHGVELRNTPRHADLHDRFGKLITAILDAHANQVKRERGTRRSRRSKAGP
jgi:DNA-binding transcriptional ArsR family regulator